MTSTGSLTPYGGLLPTITMLEKLGFQFLVEQSPDIEADSPCHGPVPVLAGNRARPLHRLLAAESICVCLKHANPPLSECLLEPVYRLLVPAFGRATAYISLAISSSSP